MRGLRNYQLRELDEIPGVGMLFSVQEAQAFKEKEIARRYLELLAHELETGLLARHFSTYTAYHKYLMLDELKRVTGVMPRAEDHKVNTFRRLYKRWKANGKQGLIDYINSFAHLYNPHNVNLEEASLREPVWVYIRNLVKLIEHGLLPYKTIEE